MKLAAFTFPLLLSISFSLTNPCSPSNNKGSDNPSPDMSVHEVSVMNPTFVENARTISAKGLFTVSDRLTIKSAQSGTIEKVYVNEGDVVALGDPVCLFKADDLNKQIEAKQAELKEAEAQLDLDKKKFSDSEEVHQPEENEVPSFLDEEAPEKPVPEKVNERLAKSRPTTSHVSEEKIRLSEAKVERITTELDLLDAKIKNLTITSALAGVVQKRNISEGSLIADGDPLFDIVANNPMTLTVAIPQVVSLYVDKLNKVRAAPVAAPELESDASLFYISPQIDPVNHTIEVRMHVANEKGILKEGDAGEASIVTRKIDKMLTVPISALIQEDDKNFIFIMQADRAIKTEVKVGEAIGADQMAITANLRMDDPIIVSNIENLKAGSFVKIADVPEAPVSPAGDVVN